MAASDLFGARPGYVPPGYRLTSTLHGELFAGLVGPHEQALLVYTRGWSDETFRRPLSVHVSPPENAAVLFGTEEKRGETVDIGVPDASAVYHDGRWELGNGHDRRAAGDVVVHWGLGDEHSLTVRHATRVYAVRGSRRNGVSLGELVRVAQSLPYPAS